MIPKDGRNAEYLKGALRRRFWYIVLPFFFVSLGSVLYCIKAQRNYKSSTLILVQPQEVPKDYVTPTVTSDTRARLNTLKEQVMSRPRLEKIITTHDLYPSVLARLTMYDAVETMRKHISVEVKEMPQTRHAAPAAFEISYEGENPTKVRDVTAAIANLFIDDNLKLREAQAVGTSRFLERELERMKEELRQKEEQVRRFKEANIGLLPEQMENNYRILAQLQQQLDSLNVTFQQTEDRRVLLQTQLARLDTMQGEAAGTNGMPLSLDEARYQLESLRSQYSDKHPDVVRLSATVAKLEKQLETPTSGSDPGLSEGTLSPTQVHPVTQAQKQDLLTQLKLIEKQLWTLAEEKNKVSGQIVVYRERIENGPKVEQMFVDLRRGYEEANESYQSLLQKKLQAALAENLERTQKGEQFVILDPANLPRKPFAPNVLRLLGLGFILALGSGFGMAVLREYVDPVLWRREDLEILTQLPVLVSVPLVTTEKEDRRNLRKRVWAAGVLASLCSVLLYALFVLWKTDPTSFTLV